MFTVAAIALVTASAAADPQRETSAEGRLAFEAAIIKLAAPDAVRNLVMPASPNRLRISSMTLTALIYAIRRPFPSKVSHRGQPHRGNFGSCCRPCSRSDSR